MPLQERKLIRARVNLSPFWEPWMAPISCPKLHRNIQKVRVSLQTKLCELAMHTVQ